MHDIWNPPGNLNTFQQLSHLNVYRSVGAMKVLQNFAQNMLHLALIIEQYPTKKSLQDLYVKIALENITYDDYTFVYGKWV